MSQHTPAPARVLTYAPETALSGRDRWLVLLAAFLGWGFDGLEQGIFPLIANPALRELTGGNSEQISRWVGYITAAWLLGAAAGGLVFGWLGDRVGRVRAMSISILMYSLFTGLGYFATAPSQLFILRFIAALGMGGEWSLGVALVMECWPENRRPLLAGCIGMAANVGILSIAVVGYLFPVTPTSWRWVMLAGALPALLTFFIRLFVPESHRWQESIKHGTSQPVKEVFSGGLAPRTILAITFASVALIGTWASVQQIPVWVDKQLSPGDPRAKAMAQIASAFGAIVGTFLAPLIGGRFGRKPSFFVLCAGSLIACEILFWRFSSYGAAFLGMVFLVGGLTASFYGWFPLYLPELFPTRVRATGQGVSYNTGRILAAVAALNIGNIVSFYQGDFAKMCGTITLVYIAGMILIWFAPETRGRPLPD